MDVAVVSLALLAGGVAAFNPCGFALLPAYLGLIARDSTGDSVERSAGVRSLMRGVRFAVGMTVGFVIVFGIAAAIFLPFASAVARTLPYVTIVIGVLLLAVGAWLLSGREIRVRKLPGFSGNAPTTTWLSQTGYGITFAVASLSCTIGPFLALVSVAAAADALTTSVAAYVAYALGMGSVVLVLAVIVTVTSGTLVTRLRNAAPVINRLSGGLLLLAGAYVAWYGWFELRVLADPGARDPIVAVVTSAQSSLSTGLMSLLSAGSWFEFFVTITGVLAGVLLLWLIGRRLHRVWIRRRCLQVTRRVNQYLDADPSAPLTEEEIGRIEEHLSACSDCTNVVADLRQIREMLREQHRVDEDSLARVQRSWEQYGEKLREQLRA